MIEVVAAIIRDDLGRYFVGRRAHDDAYPGQWEFPGGKINPNEGPRVALVREIVEELDVFPRHVGSKPAYSTDACPGFCVTYYHVDLHAAFVPQMKVHDGFQWLYLSEVQQLELTPATKACVEWLIGLGQLQEHHDNTLARTLNLNLELQAEVNRVKDIARRRGEWMIYYRNLWLGNSPKPPEKNAPENEL